MTNPGLISLTLFPLVSFALPRSALRFPPLGDVMTVFSFGILTATDLQGWILFFLGHPLSLTLASSFVIYDFMKKRLPMFHIFTKDQYNSRLLASSASCLKRRRIFGPCRCGRVGTWHQMNLFAKQGVRDYRLLITSANGATVRHNGSEYITVMVQVHAADTAPARQHCDACFFQRHHGTLKISKTRNKQVCCQTLSRNCPTESEAYWRMANGMKSVSLSGVSWKAHCSAPHSVEQLGWSICPVELAAASSLDERPPTTRGSTSLP